MSRLGIGCLSLGLLALPALVRAQTPTPTPAPAPAQTQEAAAVPGQSGTFSLGVDGPRNLTGLLAQAINKYGPAEFILVPYNKTSQAVQDAVTGRIQATLQSASVAEPFIKEGSLRPIAVAGSRRIASLPDVQSISETLKSADLQGWFMMMAPAGTPPDIVQKLSAEIDRILQEPDMQERARVLGFQIDAGKAVSPPDARQFLETEFAASGRVIKELGIEPE